MTRLFDLDDSLFHLRCGTFPLICTALIQAAEKKAKKEQEKLGQATYQQSKPAHNVAVARTAPKGKAKKASLSEQGKDATVPLAEVTDARRNSNEE